MSSSRRGREAESQWSGWLAAVAPEHRSSARNMVHYWAIRQCDLRELQIRLAAYGLSSLGRSEPHVEATLSVIRSAICGHARRRLAAARTFGVRIDQGSELPQRRTEELLGPEPVESRDPHHGHAALLGRDRPRRRGASWSKRGMNIARINCAHDDAEAWRSMARHVRQAAEAPGRTCLIAMDLAGPKLRTGPLEPGPCAVKLRPRRNALGQVVAPARAWLTAAEDPIDPPDADMPLLPVPRRWLRRRHVGDVLQLRDTRGSKRRLVADEQRSDIWTISAGFV